MDEDLKQFLTQMESRLDSSMETRINDAFTRFSQHILHEMSVRFDEVNTKLSSMDERLKLQAGLIQGGARAMSRFSAFAENAEERWVDLTKRIGALERKLDHVLATMACHGSVRSGRRLRAATGCRLTCRRH